MATNSHITPRANQSFSSGFEILTSHADAPQTLSERDELKSKQPVEARGAAKINRRTLMNMIVSTSLVGAAISTPRSSLASKGADAELIDLANQYIVAEQRYCDLSFQVDKMLDEDPSESPPEALRILLSDADLGRTPWQASDEFWTRPCDIGKWRKIDEWVSVSKSLTDDRIELVLEKKEPPAELRLRAAQIVTAFDKWQSAGHPSGYDDAIHERDEAEKLYVAIEEKIAEMRARTVEGLIAKVRCAQAYAKAEGPIDSIDCGGGTEAMALSIFEDLQELARASK